MNIKDVVIPLLLGLLLSSPFWALGIWWSSVCNPCSSVILGFQEGRGFYQEVIR